MNIFSTATISAAAIAFSLLLTGCSSTSGNEAQRALYDDNLADRERIYRDRAQLSAGR